ncbi:MAG: hypothetical protein ACYCW6_19225, partial [Candidatus Xenobia bacterium]
NATVRGVTRSAVAIVSFPQFQYALASSGPIVSRGGLEVDSTDGSGNRQQKNGNLASNSSDLQWAVQLHQGDFVSGNATAEGLIDVSGARVGGALDQRAVPVPLPTVDFSALDPMNPAAAIPGASQFNTPGSLTSPLSGIYKYVGDLTMSDLQLKQGVLYVQGALTVNHQMTGQGVVVVTGTTTIAGDVTMQAANGDQIALVSQGSVKLLGHGGADTFRGLVYTNGDFESSHILLEGAFVGNAPDGSRITLDHTMLVQNPSLTRVMLQTSTTTAATANVPGSPVNPDYLGSNGMEIPWVAYLAPGAKAGSTNRSDYWYAIVGNPGVPPQAEGPFWIALEAWMRQKAKSSGTVFTWAPGGGPFPPGWYNSDITVNVNGSRGRMSIYNTLGFTIPPYTNPGPPPNITPITTTSGPNVIVNHNGHYVFDLNQFLSPGDQLRVSFWKIL